MRALVDKDYRFGDTDYRVKIFPDRIDFLRRVEIIVPRKVPAGFTFPQGTVLPRVKSEWRQLISSTRFSQAMTPYQQSQGISRLFCVKKFDGNEIYYLAYGKYVGCFDRNFRFGLSRSSKYEFLHNQGEQVHWVGFRNPADLRGALLEYTYDRKHVLGCVSAGKNLTVLLDGFSTAFIL